MLQELSIRNFAIIEDLTIRFDAGLTILSGETGAGKSIIINAVNLLLGSRASSTLIRTGADSAELEALFEIPAGSRVADIMAEAGYDPAEGLLVRRIISVTDRHRIYINGRLATVQTLTAITANLASISGQHAHQGLLKEEEHLQTLDQYGDVLDHRRAYADCYRKIVPMIREEHDLLKRQGRQDSEIELLRFQAGEIDAAQLETNEDETLEKERLRLKSGQQLYDTVQQCIDALYSGDGAVAEQLGHWRNEMEKAGRLDETLAATASDMADLTYRVEDMAAGLRDYLRGIDLDPSRLEEVEARLDLVNKLKRKYGGSLEAVLARREEISSRLEAVENLDQTLADLQARLKEQHAGLCRLAQDLTARGARRKAAPAGMARGRPRALYRAQEALMGNDRALYEITGADREHFLQGLVSNDVRHLAEGPVYAALLSPQGKYLADFLLVPAGRGDRGSISRQALPRRR